MTEAVDVLIVGAGPVGLALAIELGQRGIRCRVVERNDRVGYSPRAKTTNVRTREHLRRWGIADELRRASGLAIDYPAHIVFATRMSGALLARFEQGFNNTLERNNLFSEGAQWVPQYVLEEVLRVRAASFSNVNITFNTNMVGLSEDSAGILATLTSTPGEETTELRCKYLVGADGARSLVRKLIGARLVGDSLYASNLNFVFRSTKLASMHPHGPAIMYWMINEDSPALLGPMGDDGLYYFIATKVGADADPAKLNAVDLIHRSTGLDIDVEIVGADPWEARQLIADKYRKGNIFLAGDACHLHPPFGGFGMNMGIGDAVDLGWKLAAMLQGWGGEDLLATYEAERKPVHEWAIREAVANYAVVSNQLAREGLEEEGPIGDATRREVGEMIETQKIREFRTLGLVKGYHYSASPIVVPDGTVPPPSLTMVYRPSAHPGCVAPHLWLRDGSSLYDHFGQGFSLLVLDDETSQQALQAFCQDAERRRIPLTIVKPNDQRLLARYQAPLALIRPDQHVAWRGTELPASAVNLLDHVTGIQRLPAS